MGMAQRVSWVWLKGYRGYGSKGIVGMAQRKKQECTPNEPTNFHGLRRRYNRKVKQNKPFFSKNKNCIPDEGASPSKFFLCFFAKK